MNFTNFQLKAGSLLLTAAIACGAPAFVTSANAAPLPQEVQQDGVVKGVVQDTHGELCLGAVVFVVGTKNSTMTDENGAFTLKGVPVGATIRCSLIGYEKQDVKWTGGPLNFTLEETGKLQEVVVTAMGIVRKEKSLTYATQTIKADELMKVEDVNLVNSLDGKVSGLTITPSAGGAGGASKILLRGSQSVMGNNSPLIVVDGVPMTNSTRNQATDGTTMFTGSVAEGSDPLSMINPDDIESINVLKGANAAALYGSNAANGVIMITTKKGKEGRLDVSFTSNVTFDTPLLTPKIQNRYGGYVYGRDGMDGTSWGSRMGTQPYVDGKGYGFYANVDSKYQQRDADMNVIEGSDKRWVNLRNKAKNDVDDFYQLGVTTNNSISLSGGTEKMKTYFSYANSHANGMVETNSYNRNTFAFRQSYRLFDRVNIEASINYIQTKTKNRVGGGTNQNPIYDLYTMPRDVDFGYYKNHYSTTGNWLSETQSYYKTTNTLVTEQARLEGPMQNWFSQTARQNNPYWLLNMNRSENKEDRMFGYVSGNVDIYDGLTFQARVSLDHSRYTDTGRRYATTQGPSSMYDYGTYSKSNYRSDEIYTDYLLSYNKTFAEEWNVSATAGWVGHLIKTENINTYLGNATNYSNSNDVLHSVANMFEVGYGGGGVTSQSKSTNWDKAALVTAQLGWREMIYIDGSYRRDWYRAFKQFAKGGTDDNYGYYSVGANAILSELLHLPTQISYLKYRLSYSEVGNSIPNVLYNSISYNVNTGTYTSTGYGEFKNPIPEKTRSFETGIESQFFNSRLNFDLTFYNTALCNSYLVVSLGGKSTPVNTGKIRNRGVEASIGYNFRFGHDWTWRTGLNFSYNKNRIMETYINPETGAEALIASDIASNRVRVKYNIGGSYGDMYVTDYQRDENGYIKYVDGKPQLEVDTDKQFGKYVGNMNSKIQLGWSNTINYKNFSLYFLINGRIGGKVISFTEAELDNLGLSKRTANARANAEKKYAAGHTEYIQNGQLMMQAPGGEPGLLIPIQTYYQEIGGSKHAQNYIYDATNFRLRELSFGYTFRNLLGENKNLTLSFVGRNLFFIYKDAPVDPDVSLSTANSLSAFECFNMPSARSYGFSLKLNF